MESEFQKNREMQTKEGMASSPSAASPGAERPTTVISVVELLRSLSISSVEDGGVPFHIVSDKLRLLQEVSVGRFE